MFYIITLPYACFGIIIEDFIVTETPPIAKWMIGKSLVKIVDWVITKHGDIYC